jgi:hypothetical protein
MKNILSWSVASLLVAGCAITPVHFDGKSATYTHHESDFAAAMLQAKDMCRSDGGKGIKHESTTCSRSLKCVSTFICTSQ